MHFYIYKCVIINNHVCAYHTLHTKNGVQNVNNSYVKRQIKNVQPQYTPTDQTLLNRQQVRIQLLHPVLDSNACMYAHTHRTLQKQHIYHLYNICSVGLIPSKVCINVPDKILVRTCHMVQTSVQYICIQKYYLYNHKKQYILLCMYHYQVRYVLILQTACASLSMPLRTNIRVV